jgi:hypothetical protein
MTGRNFLGANLLGHNQKLIKLQVIVAKAAGDWSAPRKVLLDKWTNHIALEALLVIDDVVWDPDLLRDAPGIVDVIQRTAAPMNRLGHALATGETALVPELHGQADDFVPLGVQHGRDGGGIHTARHRYS